VVDQEHEGGDPGVERHTERTPSNHHVKEDACDWEKRRKSGKRAVSQEPEIRNEAKETRKNGTDFKIRFYCFTHEEGCFYPKGKIKESHIGITVGGKGHRVSRKPENGRYDYKDGREGVRQRDEYQNSKRRM